MRILLDDSIKSYRLNANEACIYACIAKCTRAGKGWYGNYAALADAMPFEICRTTVYRALQKLLTLGLIEMREKETYFCVQIETQRVQNETESVQKETESVQIETESVQNALPPITPLNNNNMNEIKKEEGTTHVHTHDAHTSPAPQFSDFMDLFRKTTTGFYPDSENTAHFLWQRCNNPIKQAAMIAALQDPKGFRKPRPDWFISDFPDPEPQFLSGIEQDNARAAGNVLVQVKHNDLFKICTQSEAERFGLQITRIW